jgi:hypothetical protein
MALLLALLAAGCAQSPQTTVLSTSSGGGTTVSSQGAETVSLTPVERRMREQSQAFQRTVWEGALLGAGTTSLLAAFLTGQEMAMLAGGAGATAGGLGGAYIANKQKMYATKEAVLESMTADVRKSNLDTESLIASVREVIAEDRRRLAALQRQVSRSEAAGAALAAERRRIADNRAVMKQASQGAREKLSMFQGAERQYRQSNPGTNTARMQQQLNAFNQSIQSLDGLVQSVSAA